MGRLMRRAVWLLAVTGLVVGLAPTVDAAGPVVFGTPTAESNYGTGVDLTQPVTVSKPIGRVELLLTFADAIGPTVIAVPDPPTSGSSTLTYTLDTAGGGNILPNTPIVARWRLIAADDPSDVQVGPEVRVVYADDRSKWQTEAGDLVRVHWYEGTSAFGKRALRIGEDAVRETSKLLGVTETEPIDFYIYADVGSFRDALGPGTRENVGGQANANIRTLFALIPPNQIDDPWVGIVIPHELTHLVFNTASKNPYHLPPRWLNEGVAVYTSQSYDAQDRADVRDAARAGTLIPLDGLTGQFPTSAERFSLAYSESVSAVDYLVRTYSSDVLVSLIRSYADGRTDDEAFTAALGVDMSAFGAAWLDDVSAKTPTKFGPRPALLGPVPSAWTGGIGGAVTPPPGAASGQPAPIGSGNGLPVDGGAAGAASQAWLIIGIDVGLIGALAVVMLVARGRRRRAAGDAP